jgi:hypothetical protein
MGVLKSVGIDEIVERGSIKDVDVLKLRAAYYEDGTISSDEADMLLAANTASPVQDPGWAPFLVEAITDYIVNQVPPEGYITAENAAWLIRHISKDGLVATKTELDLLVTVLDKARWSPASLVHFALAQVREAVLNDRGPLRASSAPADREISEAEVELVRRILYAFGGDGGVAVTRAEAEVLFDINDAIGNKPNPAWTDLFVKAIANVLMATSGYAVPSREEALRREEWLDRRGDLSIGAIAKAMTELSLGSIWGSFQEQTPEERALARLERQRIEIITNEQITEGEAAWLAERFGRDGRMTANEAALLAFLKRESPHVHPALAELIDRTSVAA